jgi:hypothetical protein
VALKPVAPTRPRGLTIIHCVPLERAGLDREIMERRHSLAAAFGQIVLEQPPRGP